MKKTKKIGIGGDIKIIEKFIYSILLIFMSCGQLGGNPCGKEKRNSKNHM